MTAEAMLTRCEACGSVEVDVNDPYRIVTINGETYRVGYGCEVCA